MTRPDLERVAAQLLADEPVPADDRAKRAAAVGAIREALAERSRARSRRRWLVPAFGAVACAAVLAAIWFGRSREPLPTRASRAIESAAGPTTRAFAIAHPSGESAFVVRGDKPEAITHAMKLAPSETVAAGVNALVIALETGTRLELEPNTEVALPDGSAAQVVDLRKGALTLYVAKLGAGERFVVRTSDVEVEVRGTVFRVARTTTASCGTSTTVETREGRVVVRDDGREHTLGPGDRWNRPCPAPAPPVTAPAPSSSVRPLPSESAGSTKAPDPVPSARKAPEAPASKSDLAEQNTLFSEAMTSKRRGEPHAAIRSLDTLIERHPHSPLREAAEAERMKLLAASKSDGAAAAARAYLARYPNGFAAADAKLILDR